MISKHVFCPAIYKSLQPISELVTTHGIPSAGQYWVFKTQLAYNSSFQKSLKSVIAFTNLKFFVALVLENFVKVYFPTQVAKMASQKKVTIVEDNSVEEITVALETQVGSCVLCTGTSALGPADVSGEKFKDAVLLPKKLADQVRAYINEDLKMKASKPLEAPKREKGNEWWEFKKLNSEKQRNYYKAIHRILAQQDEKLVSLKELNDQLVLSSKGHVLAIESMYEKMSELKSELLKAKIAIEENPADGEPAEMQLKLQQTLEDLADKNLQISDLNATVKQKDAVISDLQAQLALRSCVKCPLARQALSKNNADLSSARGAISKLKSELAESNAATVNARGSAEALSKEVFKLSKTIEQLKRQANLREGDSGIGKLVGASPSKGTGLAGEKFGSISVAEESTSMDIEADGVQIPASVTSSPVKRRSPEM